MSSAHPGYVQNFMNYVCIFAQLPNLTVNAIGLFVDKGNLFIRIVVSLFVCIFCCLFTIIFIFVDTSSCKFLYFVSRIFKVRIKFRAPRILRHYHAYRSGSQLRKWSLSKQHLWNCWFIPLQIYQCRGSWK